MAKLTMTTFLTLDGVMQAPGGPQEDTSGGFEYGGWLFPYADEDFEIIGEWFARADAFLLGRTTYEIFAGYWPRVTDATDPIAGPLNNLPKYVASRTLEKADWNATTIVRDVVPAVADLKKRHDREVQVHGSGGLAQTLFANGLIDEYRLLTIPITLGKGKRLFDAGTVPAALRLVSSSTTSKGVAIHVYHPAGKPTFGSFDRT